MKNEMTKINLRISPIGIELIKKFEGLKLKAYICPGGVMTIGYGTTKGVKVNDVITKQQAEIFLINDLIIFENAVNTLVTTTLNQNQFDALVSLIYNIGSGNFSRSTLLKRLNEGNFESVAKQFARWNKARQNGELVVLAGLTRRRKAECDLFMKEINET